MKKISLLLIFVIIVSCFLSACGKESNNTDTDKNSNKPVAANDDYFEWDSFDTTKIVGYTEEGLKQKELTIPEKCTTFGYAALKDNKTVEKICFESDSTILTGDLFSGCSSLKSVDIPIKNQEIPTGCFYQCENLESINIPDNVIEIGRDAFNGCSSLKEVKLGKTVKEIKNKAFQNCKALTKVNFPDSLVTIGNYAFAYDVQMENPIFPKIVESIGDWAFYNCHKFTKIELPESLTILGSMAFTYCDNLTEIYLPSSLESIKKGSFGQKENIITVYVKQGSPADTQFDAYNDGMMTKKFY